MAELALDDDQRYPFASHLDGVGVPKLVWDGLKVDYDWTEEVGRITAQTLLVFADADSVRPAHIVEFYALLGGGLRDAHWDGSLRPANELAILPGLTHYDISTSPALAATVRGFLA